MKKFQTWWWFTFKNPVIRKGESGGFKWTFRRLDFEIRTVSGNFKARFTAAEHPYAYLLAGKDDANIEGFCQTIYTVGMLLTTDQKFVNAIGKAVSDYEKRLQKANPIVEDETEEKVAIENEKKVQEYVEKPKRHRKKIDREVDKRFNETMKKAGMDFEANGEKS